MASTKPDNSRHSVGKVWDILRNLRVFWRLFKDGRVPVWVKSIPFLSLGYVIWPIDLLSDFMPILGQLDDAAIILLGLKLFISLCPPELVKEHHQDVISRDVEISPRAQGESSMGETIETTYRVLDDDEAQ